MGLIDADDMKTDVINQMAFISLFGGEFAELAEILKKGIVEEIEKAPTIDAVLVVRCRDCRFFQHGTTCTRFGIRMSRAYDDYCSYGGRKNAEQVSRADDRNA